MRRFSFAFLILIAGPAFSAQENFGAGTQAAPWLKLPTSARMSAMGEASTAVADDVNTLSVNPAGLAGLKGQHASLFHHAYIQDSAQEHAAYGLGIGSSAGLAASVDFINFGAVEKLGVDAMGNLQPAGSINPSGLNLNLAYGQGFGSFAAGLNAKYVSQSLDGAASTAFGADLGLLWRQEGGGLSLGAALQNLGTPMDGAPLPMNARAGAAYRFPVEGGGGLLMALDYSLPAADAGAGALSLGAEFGGGAYALRGGYKVAGNGAAGGFSAGAGLRYGVAGLDYAFVSQGVLGNSNQVSLSVKF